MILFFSIYPRYDYNEDRSPSYDAMNFMKSIKTSTFSALKTCFSFFKAEKLKISNNAKYYTNCALVLEE